MGWAIYMEEHLNYPFEAEYLVRKKSGVKAWRKIKVIHNETNESNFKGRNYYVEIALDELVIAARIEDLKGIDTDPETVRTLLILHSRKQ
jgi:hypothetical protein